MSVRIGEIFTPDIAEWCEPLGTWSEVGYSLSTGEGFMTDGDWWEWCEAVRVAADEFGAWFVLGRSTDADLFVLQVAPVKGVALSYTLRRHNIREARFFAMLGHPCLCRGLNPVPDDYEPPALTAELQEPTHTRGSKQ